jgi:hypothetical protein
MDGQTSSLDILYACTIISLLNTSFPFLENILAFVGEMYKYFRCPIQ